MMRKLFYTAAAVFASALSFVSCSSDSSIPTFRETRWVLEQPEERFGNTVLFDWEYRNPPEIDLWFMVKAALMKPELVSLDDEKMDVEHYFAKIFNGVMFYNDDCVTAFYRSAPYAGEWKETYPKDVATYDADETECLIFLKPNYDVIESLLAEIYCAGKAKMIMDVVRSIAPAIIRAGYDFSKDKFSLYLTKETIAPAISTFLPLMGIDAVQPSIEDCLKNTDYLKLGLKFHK